MNFNMNVRILNKSFLLQPPTTNQAKYKSMLCKHFETSKGCAFKEKCQFAHGYAELRTPSGYTGTSQPQQPKTMSTPTSSDVKKGPNLQNYKIVKCKYWEKDGTCRYGTLCTFAHGDTDIRTKTDNLMLNQQQMGYYDMSGQMGFPTGQNIPGGMNYDPNFPMPMINPYAMGFDPSLMGMGPGMGMMGFPPQGMDPTMMNQMGINPYTGQPYTQQGQGNTSGGNPEHEH